jgi:DNA-binding transcriptional LysR family regulator
MKFPKKKSHAGEQRTMNFLDCAKSFINVVKYKKFYVAARASHVSPSKLTKQIQWLEYHLGITLINRTAHAVAITESGKLFYNEAIRIVEDIDTLKMKVTAKDKEPSGLLKVNMTRGAGCKYISPLVPKFLKQYPKITLDLTLSGYPLKNDTDYDVILFMGKEFIAGQGAAPQQETITIFRRGFFASPDYLKEHGEPKTYAELKNHNCLIFSLRETFATWDIEQKEQFHADGNFHTNDFETLRIAALAGTGIICCTTDFIADDLKKGKLVQVLPQYFGQMIPFCIQYPRKNSQSSAKVIAFINFLKKYIPKEMF